RHHHHGGGGIGGSGMGGAGGTGGQPHLTGSAGSTGTGGSSTGGSGGAMVDPRCAEMPGIVSWWHADGDYDDAVGSNNSTTGGAVSFGPGEENQGFVLDGVTSGAFVEVPSNPSLMMSTAFTMDAWINPSALGGRIIDRATAGGFDGYLMDVAGQWLRCYISGDQVVSAATLPVGIWTHVAAVYDGANLGVYINGVLDTEKPTFVTSINPNSLTLRIGRDSNGGSLCPGSLDEPRVFNRALSADEVGTLFWQNANCPH